MVYIKGCQCVTMAQSKSRPNQANSSTSQLCTCFVDLSQKHLIKYNKVCGWYNLTKSESSWGGEYSCKAWYINTQFQTVRVNCFIWLHIIVEKDQSKITKCVYLKSVSSDYPSEWGENDQWAPYWTPSQPPAVLLIWPCVWPKLLQ